MKTVFLILTALLMTIPALAGKFQGADFKTLAQIKAVASITGNLSSGNVCISSPSSVSGIVAGMYIYDSTSSTKVASGTTVVALPGSCSAGQIQMSIAATASATGDTLTFGGSAASLLQDTQVYVSANNLNQQLSTAISSGLIGGGGGSKNYLSTAQNGNFEQGTTTGWSLFSTSLVSGFPTNISSGAASVTTFAASTTSKLAGTYSLNTQSSAAWAAGAGFISDAFTIDTEDQAKVMTFKIYYSALSGSSNINWSGTSSNTFAVYIYDTTASAWIQPAGVYGITQGSGAGYVTGTFQTTSTSTQYRIAVVAVNASAGATSLNWDDFVVGPQTAPVGAAITDWVSYTPTGTWSANTTYAGRWRRVGSDLEVEAKVTLSGAPTGSFTIHLPPGLSIDTGKLTISSTEDRVFGTADIFNSGVANYNGQVSFNGSYTALSMVVGSASSTYTANDSVVTATVPHTFKSGDAIILHYAAPIAGWSSNVQMSNDTDTRVVAAKVTGNPASAASANPILFPTAEYDSAGVYTPATGRFTAQVPGYYKLFGRVNGTTGSLSLFIYTNGGSASPIGDVDASGNCTFITSVKLNAGDYVDIRPNATFDVASSNVTFERISGPAVIAASETVSARYSNTAGTSLSTSYATIPFATKDHDTHGAYNTSTGIYTIPVSGKYHISAMSKGVASVNYFMQALINGATVTTVFETGNVLTNNTFNVYDTLSFKAGDTVAIQEKSSSATSLATGAGYNTFSITRVGN